MHELLSRNSASGRREGSYGLFQHYNWRDRVGDGNQTYQYTKTILTAIAENEMLNEDFNRSIESWTTSTSLMDAFTLLALSSLRFIRPVANFMKTHMEKTAKEWSIPATAEAVPPPKLSDHWPQSPFLSRSSDNEAQKNHFRAHRKAQVSKSNYPEKDQENKEKFFTASIDQKTNSFSSGL